MTNDNSKVMVRVENLKKHFPIKKGVFGNKQVGAVKAVDGVSFDIYQGETLGLVGESGCGKSTTGRTLLQLYKPTAGKVYYHDQDLTDIKPEEMRQNRRNMQMIFQDPYASLNPRMTIGQIISEPLVVHGLGDRKERLAQTEELISKVGLNPFFKDRYPHEFSGGQRQRVGIARALALRPEFIVCDEAISALDVSIQAQVVNLLEDLQEEFDLTYLFIAHDLSMVKHISDRVAVMYLGKLVELTERQELYDNPLHPYTQALLSAVPIPDPIKEKQRNRVILTGDVPSPSHPPEGCNFNPRCPIAEDICRREDPEWRMAAPGHWVACHLVN
ncbi:MAG: dipeptide ABC transporter ATP-binding protein [Chloroflexi bacterium]|jgi:oligopeptide transport system ATP-binding protein|nr:dipeptide ABC transporter ATP-binding protein [Chloroflexota bacterium]MBT4305660.1 dipeptide ABC transporter ATP-binding protein [Chloroflexota bacterium]MBT4533484.1 dipeptide ABC transporter ATP-binding protein [Chloroflexota bacterium]MBT4681873.1 dipeptide ABC transporter ATP-binding protein [Chloroflexota bacterium]MBT4756268.1 dipeptide ABC transporter ATP-binding protein [Chloroflexota bacterium]